MRSAAPQEGADERMRDAKPLLIKAPPENEVDMGRERRDEKRRGEERGEERREDEFERAKHAAR